MRVEVKLFAVARQRAGRSSLEVDLEDGATVADLRRAIASACPELTPLVPGLMIAVDSEYAEDDRRIPPNTELAVIPPVSGGSAESGATSIALTDGAIDHAALTERVRSPLAGAVCLFLGTVRELTAGRRTAALEYEAYPGMAEAKLAELAAEARRRWPVVALAIEHRVGRLELGDVAVAIAVSCPHRREAFEACQWLMDTIKEVVPIWKKELWADGTEEWVHPGLDAESPGQGA